MVTPGIVAGELGQIRGDSGDWFIVDIGMSMTETSCGVWYEDGTCGAVIFDAVTFDDLKGLLIEQAGRCPKTTLNLLIEAPLSVAWQRSGADHRQAGNPGHRACDQYPGWGKRHWHYNAGASTLVAAQFLLQALVESDTRKRKVRLFEGHLSFKTEEQKLWARDNRVLSHMWDALVLRRAVWYGERRQIFCQDQIIGHDPNLILESPFHFFPRNLVPPVIRVNPAG